MTRTDHEDERRRNETDNQDHGLMGSRFVEPTNIHRPPSEKAPGEQRLTADTARQAPLGRPVLAVLIIGLAAAVLVLGLYTLVWTRSL